MHVVIVLENSIKLKVGEMVRFMAEQKAHQLRRSDVSVRSNSALANLTNSKTWSPTYSSKTRWRRIPSTRSSRT